MILVLKEDGRYARHSPDLRKLLEGVDAEVSSKAKRLDELIVVADPDFFSRKALTDLIRSSQRLAAAQRLAARTTTIDPLGAAAFYSAYPFSMFAVVVPEHKSVPKHIIMSDEDVATELLANYMARTDIPTIYTGDPPIVWLGAKEGNSIKIFRRSATSGISIYYRNVERGGTPV